MTHITHTHTPHLYILKCTNINLQNSNNHNTYIHTYTHTDIIISKCMLRISLHQTHILLNNGVADFGIPLTNKLSEFKILFLLLHTNVRNSSPKDARMLLVNRMIFDF